MWWPYWLAIAGVGMAITWFTDRTAFIGYAVFFAGIVAMQYPWAYPTVSALTIWCIGLAILISTNQNILACVFAFTMCLCYVALVFGLPKSAAYMVGDVTGLLSMAALFGTTALGLIGFVHPAADRLLHSGPLPAWPKKAVSFMAQAYSETPPEALRDL